VVDFSIGEISCNGQILFSNFNLTKYIENGKQVLMDYLSNQF
jgi:hypothetical protein